MALNVKNRTLFTGDNLDVMRGINSDSVDLIYLDPPFNSNRNYEAPIGSEAAGAAFKDAWTLSDVDVAWIGIIAEQNPTLASAIETAGLAHGKGMQAYLTMMAVRLLELKRVLQRTGSIYLHCDPTASHYLKLVMDSIFGQENFRNEAIWERTTGRKAGRQYGRVHDVLLFYSMSGSNTWNAPTIPQSEKTVRGHDLMRDSNGLFRLSDFSGAGDGPSRKFGERVIEPPSGRHWMFDQDGVDRLMRQGRIAFSRTGRPRLKTYLKDLPGVAVRDVWTDITPINSAAAERVGYPTQKPLALLERIIHASSNEGDVVFDPFCGCATALVAAETLGRQWIGIDLSSLAVNLVLSRLQKAADAGALLDSGQLPDIHHRIDVPQRTDVGELPPYKTHRHTLYGKQEGHCAGCGIHFPFRNLTVDHIVPRSRGGTDHLDNLQLLCGACNSTKGTISQAAFHAKLSKQGLR